MALITAQPIVVGANGAAGITGVFTAPSASDTVLGGDNVFLYVKVGGTATVVTIVRQVPSSYNELNNVATASLTSLDKLIGPLNAAQGFINVNTGLVTIQYSNQTGVTAAAFLF